MTKVVFSLLLFTYFFYKNRYPPLKKKKQKINK